MFSVTVDVGKAGTPNEGHTLASDGLVTQKALDAKHDHFSRNSRPGDRGDRGNSHIPNT